MSTDSKNKYRNLITILDNLDMLDMEPQEFNNLIESIRQKKQGEIVDMTDESNDDMIKFSQETIQNPQAVSNDFVQIRNIVKNFITHTFNDIDDDAPFDVLLSSVEKYIDVNRSLISEFEFEEDFVKRIPDDIKNDEKILILLLYFLHNTEF